MYSVTQDQIDSIINQSEWFVETVFDKCTLVACRLPNGFVLTASSGAVDKDNYSEEIGVDVCCQDIINQLWKMEGYALASSVHSANSAIQKAT